MQEINWVQLQPESFYYLHQQYLFKKRKVNSYFVYTIWQEEELKLNTYNEYQFSRIAYKIFHGLNINWKGY